MIYKKFQDLQLSSLGMGTMRLPIIDGKNDQIDEEETFKMVDYAIEHGVNYFDTAWGYHDGNSELAIGKALKRHPREKFYLADKFPGYDLSNMPKVKEIFPKQLEKCQVEYFDFYLIHNVCELNIDHYLDEKYGIMEYLLQKKAEGKIKHLGFSAHGAYDVMERFLKAYGEHMEFCQIQLNYIDWEFQKAKDKIELIKKYNLPVWVMEPVRGGKLAALSEENTKILKELRPEESVVAWAFRFLQSIDEVTMTLSGMSNFEQMKDNIEIFSTNAPLNEKEKAKLLDIADKMAKGVPCTRCRYCTTHCPQGLDIPRFMEMYNEHTFTGGGFLAPMLVSALPEDKRPDKCIACRSCEAVCPQQIKVADILADLVKILKE